MRYRPALDDEGEDWTARRRGRGPDVRRGGSARPGRATDDDDRRPAVIPSSPRCFADDLLALARRFGLEPWAAERDERGLWAFAASIGAWLERDSADLPAGLSAAVEAIRLVTNLFIVLGAVIQPLGHPPAAAVDEAQTAVAAARHAIAGHHGVIPPVAGAGRAMERLVRVRGWSRLTATEQMLAEALLSLYLEVLAAAIGEPDADTLLDASAAWLAVLYLRALPAGFDERLLRATSWYLETYAATPRAARTR